MLLKKKVTLTAILLATVPVLIVSTLIHSIAVNHSEVLLKASAQNRLIAFRDLTKNRVESYFTTINKQAQTLSKSKMIIEGMRQFNDSHATYQQQTLGNIAQKRSELKNYYDNEFSKEYSQQNPSENINVDNWLNDLNTTGVALQHQYIYLNSNPLGNKEKLDKAGDGSSYSDHHSFYHPVIKDYLNKFGYYDIFLVEPSNGTIVYSVYKELDFSTSLITGQFANTGIGDVFRRANSADSADFIALSDFNAYPPSYMNPAAFIASPIFDGNEKIGVLIFQMPIDRLSQIMTHNKKWNNVGLGASGETYLVGKDALMRSPSRFLIEDKSNYLSAISQMGLDSDTINKINAKNTSIIFQPVKSTASQLALNKKTGFSIINLKNAVHPTKHKI